MNGWERFGESRVFRTVSARQHAPMKIEADEILDESVVDCVKSRLVVDNRFNETQVLPLDEHRMDPMLTGEQPFDEHFSLGHKQSHRTRGFGGRQVTVGPESGFIDRGDSNNGHRFERVCVVAFRFQFAPALTQFPLKVVIALPEAHRNNVRIRETQKASFPPRGCTLSCVYAVALSGSFRQQRHRLDAILGWEFVDMPVPVPNLIHPRDEIMQTMQRIYRYRMTTTSGGNLSIREDNGDVWITPARVDKGSLTRDDIVCVKPDGAVEGPHPASSEFPFHQAVYEARPDVRAVVHAHPVALVAFSICRQTPDTRLFHQARSVCGQTGFATYALPGSEQLGSNIAGRFRAGCDSVVLENHGVVVGGQSLAHAFQRFEAFEFAAKTIIKGRQLGEIRYLTALQLEQAHSRSVALESLEPPPATSDEKELRRQLCEFVRRGCRQRLLISTEGSFSARLGEDSFLITPTQQDRETLTISDFVLVDGGRRETGKKASRAVFAHQAIYRKHPTVQAIVFAHPVNATAFSVTESELDARTIPESYVFLRDVRRAPYGVQYQSDGSIAEFVSTTSPAAILENDGVLVTGRSVLDAFDRLEVLEATAEAVINARTIGNVSNMPEEAIDELREAFDLK